MTVPMSAERMLEFAGSTMSLPAVSVESAEAAQPASRKQATAAGLEGEGGVRVRERVSEEHARG